jgi:hypothetical protein
MRLVLFFVLVSGSLLAQLPVIGEWQSFQSFSQGAYVTESEENIIYSTGNALFYLDKEDLSFTPLTRTDGLGGGRINLVKYHRPTSTLLIIYANSTIDLLRDGTFFTLPQIDNFNFTGDKRIYDVAFGADNLVYLAAGFGVTALSLTDETFRFTTFTGVRVRSVAEHGGHVYAATPEGLYRASQTGVNLNDFNQWELLGPAYGLPADYSATALEVWRDELYLGVNRDVYRWSEDGVDAHYIAPPPPLESNQLYYLSGGPTMLLAGYRCTTTNCFGRAVFALGEEAGRERRLPDCEFRTNNAIEDSQGRIWYGDAAERIRYLTDEEGECRKLTYPGPPNDDTYRILHDGTSLWIAPGQLDANTSPRFDFDGVFRYTDGSWTVIERDNTLAFRGANGVIGGNDDVATIIDVDYDPVNDVTYLSSFFEGVIGIDATGEATLYDERNSALPLSPDAGPGRIRAAGAATDAQGFTYFAVNRAAPSGSIITVRSPDGEWASIGNDCENNIAIDIAVDENGTVWVVHRSVEQGGLSLVNTAGTPMDPSDDPPCRELSTSNSVLPTNETRSIAVDLDNQVWVGTASGLVVFSCTDPLDPTSCVGIQRAVESEDGFGGLLLATVEARTIAVDGANRKWIGTNNGAYLLSEDGNEQILLLDRGNSPLLDDEVRSITIDPNSGMVYFATPLGTIGYRGDATAGEEVFGEDFVIYPNPVEPGYDGPIAIDGLVADSRIKITDLSGKLVEEGTANGGQFVWSGRDYTGRRVTSGVYLIFASATDSGSFGVTDAQRAVGKIVFLR